MSKKSSFKKRLRIMTWNIYFGADLTPLINTTPEDVPETVTEIFDQFEQTNFPARSKSIAKQICEGKPDIVGLQEVALWTIKSSKSEKEVDFLKILLKDLRELGEHYNVVAVNRNFKSSLPSSNGDIIGLLDRDVILAKCKSPMKFSNIKEKNFRTNLVVLVGNEHFTILRGWSSVDISIYDKKFRLVNTHLEGNSVSTQLAQAYELLNGPGETNLPLVFIGDFNSNADAEEAPTYDLLMNAGFIDAWNVAGEEFGFTAVQARDLLNPISTLTERIDLILFRDGFRVKSIYTVGDKQRNRTPCGLWPSDHAGVVAKLKYKHKSICPQSSNEVE